MPKELCIIPQFKGTATQLSGESNDSLEIAF